MTASTVLRRWTGRRRLLLAGPAAVAVYAAGDLVTGLLYPGYRFRDRAISELSAHGSPVRPGAVAWLALHGILVIVFAIGVWWSAGDRRALRWTAGLLLAAEVVTAPLHPFFPMSPRGMRPGVDDAVHLALTMAFGLLVAGAVAASAVALRGWFRIFAIVVLGVVVLTGGSTGPLMGAIPADLPTPWLGALERASAYTTFVWLVALATVLLRRPDAPPGAKARRPGALRWGRALPR